MATECGSARYAASRKVLTSAVSYTDSDRACPACAAA